MVDYWTTVYFDRAMFRNNPIFTVNLAVAIDDHITQAFNDYGSSLELEEVRILPALTTPDTLAVFLEIYEDDSDTIYAMGCAAGGVASEIELMMDVVKVDVEVDPESVPEYYAYMDMRTTTWMDIWSPHPSTLP